jgi:hypothetical protein
MVRGRGNVLADHLEKVGVRFSYQIIFSAWVRLCGSQIEFSSNTPKQLMTGNICRRAANGKLGSGFRTELSSLWGFYIDLCQVCYTQTANSTVGSLSV